VNRSLQKVERQTETDGSLPRSPLTGSSAIAAAPAGRANFLGARPARSAS